MAMPLGKSASSFKSLNSIKTMKYLIPSLLSLVFVALQLTALTAQTTIPEKVQNLVDELYPNAENIEYEKDGDEELVYLLDRRTEVEIIIDENGNWSQITTVLTLDQLPKKAYDLVTKEFKSQTEESHITKIQTEEDIRYYLSFDHKDEVNSTLLTFNKNGKLIEREVVDINGGE
jgi:hypothetical protein